MSCTIEDKDALLSVTGVLDVSWTLFNCDFVVNLYVKVY